MKLFTHCTFFTLLIALFTIPTFGQSFDAIYCSANAPDPVPGESCVNGTPYESIIQVSGLPNLGDNFGLVEVSIDFDQQNIFSGTVTLIAPNGTEFILVSSEEGILSMPNFMGTAIVDLRACQSLPTHDSGFDPFNGGAGAEAQPFQDFTPINDSGISPNAEWKIRYCTVDQAPNMQIFCSRLRFGALCPEITNVAFIGPSCANVSDGFLNVEATPGACGTIFYSIDGVNFQLDPNFNNLSAGEYTVIVADENSLPSAPPPSPGSETTSSAPLCSDSETVNLEVSDTGIPQLGACADDFSVTVDDNCEWMFNLSDPTFDDNCRESAIGTASITFIDGSTNQFIMAPGGGENFDYNGTGTGTMTFEWSVFDGFNGVACLTTVTIQDLTPPEWTSSTQITLTGECGVDDFGQLLDDALAQLTGTDNCGAVTLEQSISTGGILCGNASTSTLTYFLQDENGNQSLSNASIQIDIEDNTPPVISGVPADMVLNCNDSYPDIPSPTSLDLCEGDLSGAIVFDQNIVTGSCDVNTNFEVATYTWTSTDACGNATTADWVVTVFNDVAVSIGDDVQACDGDATQLNASGLSGTYLWSTGETTASIIVTESGTYSVTATGASGCCSIDEVMVTYNNLPTASANGGTLDCSGTDVSLTGMSDDPNATFAWSGPGGFTSDLQNPTVSQAGTYDLVVTTTEGCTASASTMVDTDAEVPDLTTQGGTLDCSGTPVTISASSNTAGVSYSWTGPGGFTSSEMSIDVTTAGEYNVVITAPNNCVAEGVAVVQADDDIPTIEIDPATLDCDNSEVTLNATTNDPDATFAWTGPGGFSSDMEDPTATMAGIYMLTITSDNGCTNMTTIEVTSDTDLPNISASGGEINCTSNMVTLTGSSSTDNVTYLWSGPNGFNTTMQNPSVAVAGTYTLVVEGPNGCTSSTSVDVVLNVAEPDIMATGGIIDCTNASISISASSMVDGVSFAWTGPNNFVSTEQNPMVSEAGTYTVVITAPNGCTNTRNVDVTVDMNLPTATATGGSVDCQNSAVNLQGASSISNSTYEWTGPNNFTSAMQNPSVAVAGIYTLMVTSPNGCLATDTALVTVDADLPQASLTVGAVDCNDNNVNLMVASTDNDLTYQWMMDSVVISNTNEVTISAAGSYTVQVTSTNGCTITFSYDLQEDIQDLQANVETTNASGSGDDGTATIQILNSNLPVTILWDNGQTGMTATGLTTGPHTVSVTNALGCVSTFTFDIQMSTAVTQIDELTHWKIYPAQTETNVTLEAEFSEMISAQLIVTNLTGQKILVEKLGTINSINHQIDVSDFAAGMYLISLVSEGKIKTDKFVKL